MTMLSISTPVPTRQSVLSTLGLWASTGMTARESVARSRPVPRFTEADVLWSIELRPGFSEFDDPDAHRMVPQHAYLGGRDDVAVCGHRPSRRGFSGRAARLGLPSPSHDLQCADCRRLAGPTVDTSALSSPPVDTVALSSPPVIAPLATVDQVPGRTRDESDDPFEQAEEAAGSAAAIEAVRSRPQVGIAAWRMSVAQRPHRITIRDELLMAPDYRSPRVTELPPKLGRCEFTTAQARCTKPGRWHRHGFLTCRVHAAARAPRAWGAATAA